jgi:hypothetical protein
VGDYEVRIQVRMESTVEYHSVNVLILTLDRYLVYSMQYIVFSILYFYKNKIFEYEIQDTKY